MSKKKTKKLTSAQKQLRQAKLLNKSTKKKMEELQHLQKLLNKQTTPQGALNQYKKSTQQLQKTIDNMAKNQASYIKKAESAQKQVQNWNANQAKIDRDWQEKMSATAHQREVADLKAAGLSPVLSANAGAPVGSGAQATSSNDMTDLYGNMITTAMSAVTQAVEQINSSNAQLAQSAMQTYATRDVANTSAQAQKYSSDMAFNSTKYSADTQYKISKYAADLSARTSMSIAQAQQAMQERVASIQAAASNYAAELSAQTGVKVATINRVTSKYSADMAYKASVYGTKVGARTTAWKTIKDNMQSELNTNNTNTNRIITTIIDGAFGLVGNSGLPGTMASKLMKKFTKK